MKISSFGILALVIFVTSAPTLALAESDDDQGSYQDQEQKSSSSAILTQAEHQEGNTGNASALTTSSLVLYGTISAILCAIGYSAWKVYNVRRKVASRNLA